MLPSVVERMPGGNGWSRLEASYRRRVAIDVSCASTVVSLPAIPSMASFIVRLASPVAGCLRHSRRCADLATSGHRPPRTGGGDGAGKPALAVSHHEAEHQQHGCQPPRCAVTASVRAVAAGALPDWQRPAFTRVENGYSSRQLLAGRVPNGWRGSQLDRASLALGCPTVSRRSRAGLDRIGAENVR
jgi:hypothetical protein